MAKKKIGIIGGGISGTALGYHLSLYDGEAEVIVFEKDTIVRSRESDYFYQRCT